MPISAFARAACGGGGGGDDEEVQQDPPLTATFDYGGNGISVPMWVAMTESPTLLGLDGHTPTCSLSEGSLPAGVSIDRNTCAVVGTPNQYGDFNFTVRLTVTGFSGAATASGNLSVSRPAISYFGQPLTNGLEWRQPSTSTPEWVGYQPGPNDTIGNFRVEDASLPYGLSIDANTGVVSGTLRGFGMVSLTIHATITHNGQTLDVSTGIIDLIAMPPSVAYPGMNDDTVAGRVGQPYTSDAPLFSDGSPMSDEYTASFTLEMQSNWECDTPRPCRPG